LHFLFFFPQNNNYGNGVGLTKKEGGRRRKGHLGMRNEKGSR